MQVVVGILILLLSACTDSSEPSGATSTAEAMDSTVPPHFDDAVNYTPTDTWSSKDHSAPAPTAAIQTLSRFRSMATK